MPSYSYKHKQWQLAQRSSSTWWKWQGSWWSSYNSESQEGGEPSLEWTERPVTYSILAKTLPNWLSRIQFILLQMDSLKLTAVYCNRREVQRQHLKWPVFAMQKCATILVTDEIDDHRIQSDYKCTIGLQNLEGKNSTVGITFAWWNRATRRTTPMTTWPPRPRAPSTQRTWTSTRELMHAWSHVRIVQ